MKKILPTFFILLLVLLITASNGYAETQITIDTNQEVGEFNPEMLGVASGNWDHSWDKPFINEIPNLDKAFEAGGIRLLRYAGGLWANYVGWTREDQRTPYNDYVVNGNTYSFHYGKDEIDDLAAFAKKTDVEIMIQVNIVQNDPQMWADMVKYTNIENDYNFTYWEIGNELDLEFDKLGISATDYATRLDAYTKAMKAVDPTIHIIGGVPAAAHGAGYNDAITKMSDYLAEASQVSDIDSLSYHWYQTCSNNDPVTLSTITNWSFPNVAENSWRNNYSRNWSYIAPKRINEEIIDQKDLKLGVTELNLDACDFERAPVNSNHMNALWLADILPRMAFHGVDYVTFYQGYGNSDQGYPMIVPFESSIALRPSYYTYYLLHNYFGDTLLETGYETNPQHSIFSSKDKGDNTKLYVLIINLDGQIKDYTFSIPNVQNTDAYVLTSTQPTDLTPASNEGSAWTRINGQQLRATDLDATVITPQEITIDNNVLSYQTPAYSASSLVVSLGSGIPSPTQTIISPTAASVSPTPTPVLTPTTKPGDLDNNQIVDSKDVSVFANLFKESKELLDINEDGTVNVIDFSLLLELLIKQ